VTIIQYNVFSGCSGLTSVTLPNSLKEIREGTFAGCKELTGIILPENIKSISTGAFSDCENLAEIILPESITSIGEDVFNGCGSLVSINIPSQVEFIEKGAFANCQNLSAINVSVDSEKYVSIDGVLFSYDMQVLVAYPAKKDGSECIVPVTVLEIVPTAFSLCRNLEAIKISPDNLNYADIDGVLFSKDKTRLIIYPNGKKDDEYTVPVGTKIIGVSSFDNCLNLISIIISEGVTTIENSAFCNCKNLAELELPQSITKIGWQAPFKGCNSLAELMLPDAYVIEYSFIIQESNLKAIKVSENNEHYSTIDGVLFDKDKTKLLLCPPGYDGEYVVPEGVISIGFASFLYCNDLTSIILSDSVKSIGDEVFSDALAYIFIPSSVEEIGFAFLSKNVTIITPEGSYAEEYAKKNNIPFSNI